MSFDDDNNSINKKKISEDEEGEDEDDSEEQKKKNKKPKMKVDLSESENSNESKSNSNDEDNENSEDDESIQSGDSSNNKSKNKKAKKNNKSNKKRNREEYIAYIEELKNELNLEKSINNKLEDSENFDEYIKLRKDLDKAEDNLKILKITNKKQKLALSKLKNELDKINEKEKENLDKELLKEGDTHFLKKNDKTLERAIYKMNILKKKNDTMKNILYQNEDYNIKINLEDKTKNYNDKIEERKKEKNLIMKQLEQHQLCIKEREQYTHEYNNLKEDSKKLKKNIQNMQIKIDELLKKNGNVYKPKLFIKKNNNININLIKHKFCSNSTSNIKSNKNIILKDGKHPISNRSNRRIELPLIFSNSIINPSKSTASNNFKKKLKEFLDGDEDQYMTLMNKINNMENNKKIMENKYINVIQKYNTKINLLDDKYKYLNINSKESNNNIILLKYKINIIKKENKKHQKQLNELKKELKEKENICKQKNIEISSLLTEINSIKNTVKNDDVKSTKSEIVKYIKKIKKQKGIIESSNNEEEEIEKNNDENIQVDFSDNEEYENDE